MPYRKIPETTTDYFLVAVDEDGQEKTPDPDFPNGPISERLIGALAQDRITDVFVWCHGWKGDMRGAVDQYDRWIAAFAAQTDDRKAMLARQPNFKELHLGLHWPSLAWGNEDLAAGDSFAPGAGTNLQMLEDLHAATLGDTPAVRAALHTLFGELRTNIAAAALSPTMKQAYLDLDQALALGDSGLPGDGAADRAKFDPDQAVMGDANAAFGLGSLGNKLFAPLRQLTFWTMKKRAKEVGEKGLHPLLQKMQAAAPSLRIHLMGHSFGCIVVSSALAGVKEAAPLARPVASCVLVQGATSLWAFAASNPFQEGAGYFSQILSKKSVRGPLVSTRSSFDYALGRIYPWAAGIANQVAFEPGEEPQFGAIGIHGLCGLPQASGLPMKAAGEAYQLAPGGVYNVDGSKFISKLDGMSGAHSDIGGPEVAHLIWQAALAGVAQ